MSEESTENQKMEETEAGIQMSEAKNFIILLEAEIKETGEEKSKLARYLHYVVPFWSDMEPTRLYKHIQRMLDNAEQIRRFEIELLWKRATYFAGLLIIFFGAFGSLFFADEKYICLWENKISLNELLLPILAFTNAVLFFFFAKLNSESHKWQRNWEYHVDYLQELLGVKLMRTHLRSKRGWFSIGTINIAIPIFIALIWFSIFIIFLLSLSITSFITFVIAVIVIITVTFFILVYFYTVKRKSDKQENLNKDLSTTPLENYDFSELGKGDRLNKNVEIKHRTIESN